MKCDTKTRNDMKDVPLRQGMTITFREKNGRYVTAKILKDWYTASRTHLFILTSDKGTFTLSGHELYPTAKIIAWGRYTIYDYMKDRLSFRKTG